MKKQYALFWKLYPSFVLMMLIPLLLESGYADYSMRRFFSDQIATNLESKANLLKEEAERYVRAGDEKSADLLCKKAGKASDSRITIILASGRVIGDSDILPGAMENHNNRPEVSKALSGQTGTSIRHSDTIREPMMYLAIPLKEGKKITGILRTSVSISAMDRQSEKIRTRISLGAMVIALLAALASFVISKRISTPIEKIRQGAEHFANGNLEYRLSVSESPETGLLAKTMNNMAANLEDRMQTIIRQRNELEAVLSSMSEGVLAINPDETIISINPSAAKMFGTTPDHSLNRSIQEVIRNSDLNEFAKQAISDEKPLEQDICFHHQGKTILNTRSRSLKNAKGNRIGTLIVFNNVTRLRQLENIRRDFAANVSHEIRTPLTAIKGFAETLRNGAIDNPEEARRFLGIIENHADRLIAIVADLMSLSRIEQKTFRSEIEFEECPIKPLLVSAIRTCQAKADEKRITIVPDCDESLSANLNARLAEQAFVNLLDNAVKYGNPETNAEIRAYRSDSGITVEFRDHGIGIAQEHLPRLFERFYRADKSRSRKQGGTGLGLAIVRHIMNAHGGTVAVESELGKGSVFSVCFPKDGKKC